MHVRTAKPEDAEAVRAVCRRAWHAAYDDVIGPRAVEERVDEWYAVDALREQLTEGIPLVAENDGAVVGVAQASPNPASEETWTLGRLYVHPDRWSEGIGTRLLDALERRLPEDAARLRLEVFVNNEVGRGFYEGRGFEQVGEAGPEAGQPVLVYEKRF